MSSLQLSQTVSDKAAAVGFLQQRGILHNPRNCANCVRKMMLNLRPTKGCRWRCSVRGCCREIGLRKNTWLEYSNLPYRVIVLFLYGWPKEMTSVSFCEPELDIGKTTLHWLEQLFKRGLRRRIASSSRCYRSSRQSCRGGWVALFSSEKSLRSCVTPAVGFRWYRSSITRMLYVHCAR